MLRPWQRAEAPLGECLHRPDARIRWVEQILTPCRALVDDTVEIATFEIRGRPRQADSSIRRGIPIHVIELTADELLREQVHPQTNRGGRQTGQDGPHLLFAPDQPGIDAPGARPGLEHERETNGAGKSDQVAWAADFLVTSHAYPLARAE